MSTQDPSQKADATLTNYEKKLALIDRAQRHDTVSKRHITRDGVERTKSDVRSRKRAFEARKLARELERQ